MAKEGKKYDNKVAEETSAIGERGKGALKEAWGAVTGDSATERDGERQNAAGRARQSANQVFGSEDKSDRRWLTGTFSDRDSAEGAYNSLTSRGYSQDDVNLLMSDDTRKKYFANDTKSGLGSKAVEGAGAGVAIGGTVGAAILASIVAAGTTLAIPGLGIVIAGPIAAAIAGAGAGGLTGGIIGALVGAGIPEDRAKLYDEDIRKGRIVMGVNPRSDEDAEYFESEWRKSKGENIYR